MTIEKGRNGWAAHDYIELGEREIVDLGRTVTAKERIKVSTYKGDRGLATHATFVRSIPSGTPGVTMEQHRLFEDFGAVVERNQVRATEKTVREQHERIMAKADWLKDIVSAHQREVAEKKAAQRRALAA